MEKIEGMHCISCGVTFSLFDNTLSFNIWFLAIGIAALLAFYILYKKYGGKNQPRIFFSSTSLIKNVANDKTFVLNDRRNFCLVIFLLLSLMAFSTPQILEEKKETISPGGMLPKEGVALYLVLDRSSSMQRKIPSFRGGEMTLLDLLKETTKEFVQGRHEDLLGVISFARIPQVVVPLTFDKGALYQGIDSVSFVVDKENEDGTAIGYAIYKTAHLINAVNELKKAEGVYQIQDNAIVLVTDGLQSTHPDDLGHSNRSISLDDAALYAKEAGVRLYIINLFPDLHQEKYAPEFRQLERVTKMTGGRFFSIANPHLLPKVYKEIDQLEKSTFIVKSAQKEWVVHQLYPLFLGWALLFLLIYLALDYAIYLRVP